MLTAQRMEKAVSEHRNSQVDTAGGGQVTSKGAWGAAALLSWQKVFNLQK